MSGFRFALATFLALATFVVLPGAAQTISNDTQHAKVLSVREVRHASLRMSRYATIPQYTMDLALQVNGQTYCTGYETPVLDEVHELLATNGHDVSVTIQGKKVMMTLPNGRRVQAELVKSTQC